MTGLRVIRAGEKSGDTAQTPGMVRSEAISGRQVGAQSHPAFVFRDPATGALARLETSPGDFVWVPPDLPHREENPDPEAAAVVVIARSTQEAIVVSVDAL